MKIGYITADWSNLEDPVTGYETLGGAGWYRCGIPAAELARNGIDTVVGEYISVSGDGVAIHHFDGTTHDDCDILVFQRWMDKNAPRVIATAQAAGQVVVNDVDDWYWGLDKRNAAYEASDPRNYPDSNRDHYWKAIMHSDYITVSTPFLADKLKGPKAEVILLRNAIDLSRWRKNSFQKTSRPRIGWVGSTTHRSGDLETLKGVLGPFCERVDTTFMHCGYWPNSVRAGDLAGVPQERQDVTEIVSILEYPKLFHNMDVGLVPLRMCDFNYAKSAIKGMEYAASGVPFISQNAPEYVWLKEEHDIGLVAKKPRDWIRHLNNLIDPDFRAAERKRNAANLAPLDIKVRWKEWASAYESMLA